MRLTFDNELFLGLIKDENIDGRTGIYCMLKKRAS